MATSGTTNFTLDLKLLVEEAFERCGLELRGGYDYRTAIRSLNLLMIEWGNRGLNLWTVEQQTQTLTAGVATYAIPADTVDLIEHILRINTSSSSQTDYSLQRISVSTYADIPNKLQQSRPTEIYIERLETPQFTLWPVPDSSSPYQVIYWRLRRIQDAGSSTDTMDIPYRFIPAMVAGLAYHLSVKRADLAQRVPFLKAAYEEAWDEASSEDREKAPLMLIPFTDYYTP